MKLFYKALTAAAGLASLAALAWARRDYRRWIALGPGGLPANPRGWITTTRLRIQKIDPLDTDRYAVQRGGPLDGRHLGALAKRPGPRPAIGVHPVPHRQLDQLPDRAVHDGITRLFDSAVERYGDSVHYQLSYFEKRHLAIFLRALDPSHAHAAGSHGEIAHVHPSDGSMHMILSYSDAQTVIEAGWGEMHPLAGQVLGLPDTYLLIYPPRDDKELAVTGQILDASIAHMAPGARWRGAVEVKLPSMAASASTAMQLKQKA